MKIGIATDKGQVSGHFGHCEGFTIYDGDKGIDSKEFILNPGHKKGFLPVFLDEKGVDVVISGGMGGGAVKLFNEKNIEVVTGAQGDTDKVFQAYINGELESTGSICNRHDHADSCGEH